ncbi:hypothetical protein GLOIN_2v1506894 [Rhizophagus clarus]|uniref:Uncharacterized protein n=1 Tax=Rhizophagus clarus TaxID=94130 RepID=A0A8H3KVQ6_9GLOM|nr:hypothetical protein GLOIN_2v1506894 [Rhizophagus clarus]
MRRAMGKKIDRFFRDTLQNSRSHIVIRDRGHYGNEPEKSSINGEFDDFAGRRGDYTNHVWSIGSQWETRDTHRQAERSGGESKNNTDTPMNDRPKIWKNEDDASVCQVSASDEGDGVQGYRNNLPTIVETIMNSNRCYIANSLGFKLYDEDQEDYISYIKEELIGFIEEIVNFGFDHIIIIGELNYGMLFLDCFGRVFDFDAMTCTVLFLGDCSERIKRVTKRLKDVWVQWIVDSDEGKIVEANGPEHYLIPFRKKQIEKKPKKKKKKKGSGKKHH